MRIILLQDVPKIGKKWEEKNVSDGFAQNSLIPRGLAEAATKENAARALKARAAEEVRRNATSAEVVQSIAKIKGARVEVSAKANEQRHLFAALHEKDIAKALSEKTGVNVPPELLRLPHPVKTLGEHAVSVSVSAGDAKAEFVLVVSAL